MWRGSEAVGGGAPGGGGRGGVTKALRTLDKPYLVNIRPVFVGNYHACCGAAIVHFGYIVCHNVRGRHGACVKLALHACGSAGVGPEKIKHLCRDRIEELGVRQKLWVEVKCVPCRGCEAIVEMPGTYVRVE